MTVEDSVKTSVFTSHKCIKRPPSHSISFTAFQGIMSPRIISELPTVLELVNALLRARLGLS